jgi:hypothetical protein
MKGEAEYFGRKRENEDAYEKVRMFKKELPTPLLNLLKGCSPFFILLID